MSALPSTSATRRAAARMSAQEVSRFNHGARVSVRLAKGDRAFFLTTTEGAPYEHKGAWFVRVKAPFVIRPIHPLHELRLCQ